MPATEAQLLANRRNAQRSKGPVTPEGKERSRANSLKHGLTGEGIVLAEEDAAEVEQMAANLESELRPSGTMGRVLVRRIATHVVRMDRSVLQETAALSERVRQAEADFEAPEGLDADEVDRLRLEAGRRAMFDPSKEATLARKYEAAAERGFFRALKEFRQVERDAKAATSGTDVAAAREQLASFFPAAKPALGSRQAARDGRSNVPQAVVDGLDDAPQAVVDGLEPIRRKLVRRADHDRTGPLTGRRASRSPQ